MPVVEGQDFILVKHANYGVGLLRHSGNLVVVPGRIILNVLQVINPLDGGSNATTMKEAVAELKESTKELKQSTREMFDYGRGVKAIRALATEVATANQLADGVIALTRHETSLDIDVAGLRGIEIGFFKGIKMTFADGRKLTIRTGKLGAIRKLLGV